MRSVLLGSAALALAAMTITPALAQSMGGSGSTVWQGHHGGGGDHDGHHGDRGRIKGFPTFPNLAIPDSAQRLSHRYGRGSYGGDYGYGGYGDGYAYVDDHAFQSNGYNDWWHDRPDRAFPRWVQAQGRVDTACSPERMWWHGSTLSC